VVILVEFLSVKMFSCLSFNLFSVLIIRRNVIEAEFISRYSASQLVIIFMFSSKELSLGILSCSFAWDFSSPFPSLNRRHHNLIRSNIAATLPCERILSKSEN
jgi:hypothetical protein